MTVRQRHARNNSSSFCTPLYVTPPACAGNWRTSPNCYASPARVYSDPEDDYVGQYAQEEDDGQSLDDEVGLVLAVMSRSKFHRAGVPPIDFGSDCACGCCMRIASFSGRLCVHHH